VKNSAVKNRQAETVPLVCADGCRISATRHPARSARGAVVIAPAVAVPQSFYTQFAQYVSDCGYDCWTFDYRGCGSSRDTHFVGKVRLEDWGRYDLDTVLRAAVAQAGGEPWSDVELHLVGHSIGGQLIGLAEAARYARRIVLIAASAPYWKRWPLPDKLSMLAVSHFVMPLVAAWSERFPARMLGMGRGDLPSAAMAQWAAWMRRPDYLFGALKGVDIDGYARVRAAILSVGFTDDRLVPLANVGPLLERFEGAVVRHLQLTPGTLGLQAVGHVGYFRQAWHTSLWGPTMVWLTDGRIEFDSQLSHTGSALIKRSPGSIVRLSCKRPDPKTTE
jgi:predicted alpha/beta hydrolase